MTTNHPVQRMPNRVPIGCRDDEESHTIVKFNSRIHHRRSIRLQKYDYSRSGAYFVTLCAHNRVCVFGDIVDRKMRVNDAGKMAQVCWQAIPDHYPYVNLDAFVVMPNHVHGILFIIDCRTGAIRVGAKNFSPLQKSPQRPHGTSKTIGSVIRGFKIGVTKWMRANTPVRDVWQRNYWERVIRNESELNCIREYIRNNPLQWEMDRLNDRRTQKIEPDSPKTEDWMV